jgi:hypothetical protein
MGTDSMSLGMTLQLTQDEGVIQLVQADRAFSVSLETSFD